MTKRVLILVEGQTEERFVKDVLAPELIGKDLVISPTVLMTKLVKDGPNFKGGVARYSKLKSDARRLLQNPGGALVTTMIDYYGLPSDFPGMASRPHGSPYQRVAHVEAALKQDLGNHSAFLAFLTLHEFEALLFSSPDEVPRAIPDLRGQPAFAAVCSSVDSPEEINDSPTHAPSKRIQQIFPTYQKVLHGTTAAQRIGLGPMRARCPHFNDWVTALEQFAVAP